VIQVSHFFFLFVCVCVCGIRLTCHGIMACDSYILDLTVPVELILGLLKSPRHHCFEQAAVLPGGKYEAFVRSFDL